MFDVFKQWYKKNFSDPNAVALMLLIILSGLLISWFGDILTPVFVAIVFAFLLEWPIKQISQLGLNRNISTLFVITVYYGYSCYLEAEYCANKRITGDDDAC
jgi:putative permease